MSSKNKRSKLYSRRYESFTEQILKNFGEKKNKEEEEAFCFKNYKMSTS